MPGLEGVKGGGWNGTLEILYGGGGGGAPPPPHNSTLYSFVYYFHRKATPFAYLWLKKEPLSHNYLRTLYLHSKLLN